MDVDLVDEFYVRATPEAVAAAFHDADAWKHWWPDLELTVFQDRGTAGLRWSVTGAYEGSLEIWLEEKPDGVLVHHYLRLSDDRKMSWRRALRVRHRRAVAWKRHTWAIKDRLEADRPVPAPPAR
ncbi:MAG TPA: polyketide cyclase / dehydrase and lipid transport [Mycobacteriales bacterium]|nr:polyketide cyclase / dehydrase and lipid transport [Mycobacteriales bacterium]